MIHSVSPGLARPACVCLFAACYWSKVTEFAFLLFVVVVCSCFQDSDIRSEVCSSSSHPVT